MKKLILVFIVSIFLIFGNRCASIPTEKSTIATEVVAPEYTTIYIPHTSVPNGIALKIPTGVPNFLKFEDLEKQPMSDMMLGLLYRNLKTGDMYGLIVERGGLLRIFALVDMTGEKSIYYIYPVPSGDPVLVDSWKEVKDFLAEFDPAWKRFQEEN